jgi:ectoine hydroxylase-related dioxygenase (phytanoyl-CoA dioxygenase family)
VENVERMARSMINVWSPLVPVSPRNGCMQFSRGSHKLGLVEHAYRRDLGLATREGHWLHVDEAVQASHCSPESGRVVDVVMEPGCARPLFRLAVHSC